MSNPRLGSSFSDFLDEEGIREDIENRVVKQVLAWQIQQEMAAQGLSKSAMARRMKTSRTQLERLLDPTNDRVQLETMQRAATALGRTLRLELR